MDKEGCFIVGLSFGLLGLLIGWSVLVEISRGIAWIKWAFGQ